MRKPNTQQRIEWKSSTDGKSVPFRSGLALCSAKYPVKESERWLSGLPQSVSEANTILVLGLGGGYHILALERFNPHARIEVLEIDTKLKTRFEKSALVSKAKVTLVDETFEVNTDTVIQNYDVILSFQPSWQNAESDFQLLEAKILGSHHVREYLDFSVGESVSKFDLWSALGELVR